MQDLSKSNIPKLDLLPGGTLANKQPAKPKFMGMNRAQRRQWAKAVRKRLMATVRLKYEKRPNPFEDEKK